VNVAVFVGVVRQTGSDAVLDGIREYVIFAQAGRLRWRKPGAKKQRFVAESLLCFCVVT